MSQTSTNPIQCAVYTGSFDPITLGHLNVIQRASKICNRLVVGIGMNIEKRPLFEPNERLELVKRVTSDLTNVEVQIFDGLAVEFVKSVGANVMIRGVRPLTDIAAEFTMTIANKKLDPNIETVFLMADANYAHVSSTLIKQVAPLANDEKLAGFVPSDIIPDLRRKLAIES